MSLRREVFQAKVLQRLYPAALKVVEKALETPAHHLQAATSVKGVQPKPNKVTHHEGTPVVSGRKMYTVLPPPKNYLPTTEDGWSSAIETLPVNDADELLGSGDHSAGEDDQHTVKKRKRRRKRKAATPSEGKSPADVVTAADDDEAKDADGAKKENTEDSGCLSKNKRRKMKKKRHKEKLLALGLVARSTALEFTYKESEDKEEEDDEDEEKKVEEVLEFLRSTRDLYLSDRSYSTSDLSDFNNATESLLTQLSDGTSPPAVLPVLCRLRAMLRQNDAETLHSVLHEFSHTSSLPKDETEAIYTLFQYWRTEVLPMQTENTT